MNIRKLFSRKLPSAVLLSVCATLAAPQAAPAVTLTQVQKLTATAPAANDFLGWSVDVSSNRMIAGATGLLQNGTISGYAIIFDRGSDGAWSQSAKLVPDDGAARDQFGRSVAVSGNRAAVGAHKDDHGSGRTDAGAVYVFDRGSDGAWSQTAKLVASDAAGGDEFGYSVAISGGRVVVGAHRDDHSTNKTDAGAVYVFDRGSDGTWSQTAKLIAHDAYLHEYFGSDVAISGNRVVIGAREETSIQTDSGAVYIFEENTRRTVREEVKYWTQVAKLKAGDAAREDRFGHSVAISGGRILAGTPSASLADKSEAGAVYVFDRGSSGTWSQTAKLTASDGSGNDRFGYDVDLSGDTAIVGTHTGGNSVYVFARGSSGTWSQDQKLVPTADGGGGTASDGFGWSVSISSGRAAVGAPGDDGVGNAAGNSGSAYIYNFGTAADPAPPDQGSGDGPDGGRSGDQGSGADPGAIPEPTGSDATYTFSSRAQKLTGSGAGDDDLLGWSVAVSGDRMIAGASGLTNGQSAGYAYIYERSSSGVWVERARLSASDGAARDQFGHSVAISGDRAVVGAYRDDVSRGSAYVFERNSSGRWTQVAKLTAGDGESVENFGWSVAVSGSRAAVGSPWHSLPGKSRAGAVYVFDRGPSGTWSQSAKLTAGDGSGFDRFGQSVAMSGSRIMVGAHQESGGARNSGAAYIFARSSTGTWAQTAKLKAQDPGVSDEFGWSVAISGSRAVVGAHRDSVDGNNSAGSAYVFERSSSGTWAQTARLTAGDEAATGGSFGESVALLGGTAIVGMPDDGSGAVYVFARGSSGAWSRTRKLVPTGDGEEGTAGDRFGQSVAVSSEGRMAVGATGDDGSRNTLSRAGSVYLYGAGTATAPDATGEENPAPGTGPGGDGGGTGPDGSGTGTPGSTSDPAVEAAWNEVLNNLDTQGSSVAISGDTAIAGSDGDTENGELSGSAVIFERSSDGVWSQTRKVTASDGKARALFGRSVAVSGSRTVVGAIGDDTNGQLAGAVYVFDKNPSDAWAQTAKLVAGDGTSMDFLGRSVSVSGDTVIAGAEGYDEDESITGAAYVFERSSDGEWAQTRLLASDGESGDNFGESVSMSGDRAVIGAPRVGDNGQNSGAVYIFEKDSSGTWTQAVKLSPNDGERGDFFGESVSISGSRAIVGSELDDDEGPSTGAAYIFERSSDGVWAQSQKLTAGDDADSGDRFGESVSISGDRAVVGVNGADSAYVYRRDSEGIWVLEEKLTPETPAADYFGDAVAISGDRVALISSRNTASIYEISSEEEPVARASETVTLPGSVKLTAGDGAAGDLFGRSASVSGARAIVGATGDRNNGVITGAAYVFERGSEGAWTQVQKLLASDGAANDGFGISVSISGNRAVAGALNADGDATDPGAAYVFERDSSGSWTQVQKLAAGDAADNDTFGASVSVSGDRAIVGNTNDDDSGNNSGSAYVFDRNSEGTWSQSAKLLASDGARLNEFGASVSVSGDRAVVSAIGDDDNGSNSGSAYVFDRNSEGAWSQSAKLTPEDGTAAHSFGISVSVSGNIAVVGADGDGDNGTRAGAVYVFERSTDDGTWNEVSKLTASDAEARDTFGRYVSVSGNRIMVGAEINGDNGAASGSAYMFERNSDGSWSETTKLLAGDGAAGDLFGGYVAISGDTAVVAAPGDDTGRGSVYVYEPSTSAPSAPGAGSDSGPGGVDGRSGREVARLSIATPGQRSALSSGSGGCALSSSGSGGCALTAALALMLIPAFAGFGKRKRT